MWRINWMADPSPRGMANSCGIMVNYRYYHYSVIIKHWTKRLNIFNLNIIFSRYYLNDAEANSKDYIENYGIKVSNNVISLTKEAEKFFTPGTERE